MKKSDLGSIIFMLIVLSVPGISWSAKAPVKKIISQEKYIDKYYQVDEHGNKKLNIYLGDERIATIDISAAGQASTSFPLTDHLGSPTIITDLWGQVIGANDYKSFGFLLSSAGYPYKFIGKELDSENNLEYFGQRYYDSMLARFVSIDPVLLGDFRKFLVNPQALNSYSYALNNPIVLFDLFGLSTATTNPMPDSGWQLGDVMGQFNGVAAYYNGIGSLRENSSCVEYAKRYMSKIYGVEMGSVINPNNMWDNTDSINANIAKNNSSYMLVKHKNGQGFSLPKEGDMLIWTDKYNGHVMIVTESKFDRQANSGYVEVIDQNAQNTAVSRYDVNKINNGYSIVKKDGQPMAGWLSLENNHSTSPANSASSSRSQHNFFQRLWQNTRQIFNKIF